MYASNKLPELGNSKKISIKNFYLVDFTVEFNFKP